MYHHKPSSNCSRHISTPVSGEETKLLHLVKGLVKFLAHATGMKKIRQSPNETPEGSDQEAQSLPGS